MVDRAQTQAREEMQRDEDIRTFDRISAAVMGVDITTDGLRHDLVRCAPNFTVIGFKPSKDNKFTHPNEESEFQIYGVKHVYTNDNS